MAKRDAVERFREAAGTPDSVFPLTPGGLVRAAKGEIVAVTG